MRRALGKWYGDPPTAALQIMNAGGPPPALIPTDKAG